MKKDQKLAILDRLEEMYPEAKAELVFSNPYEMLVATMLSAQCTDKQVNKVTPAVFARYPDVRTMAEAQAEDLYPMVKSCGFKSKAGNIIAACRMIQEEHGGQVPDTREALVRLPGVGRKTANVVLRHSCDCGGHPCVPREQPAGAMQGGYRGGDGETDDPPDPGRAVGAGASLADLARQADLQGAAPFV